ncbi:MAG: M48 family metalloprotease [Actinomycetota bacterium]|nr:M48 family metalloprotease [Actinomycetota bacterium]
MSTVSYVKLNSCRHVAGSLMLAFAAAELGVQVLRPRGRPIAPAGIELEHYFSAAEIERGARFARPQLALGLARGAIELGVLGAATAAAGRMPQSVTKRPVLGGALTGVALSSATTLAPLPLAALSRRRAIAVGLVTQSWRGWAIDLVKANAIGTGLAAAGGGLAVAVTRRYPRGWWAPVGGGSVVVGAVFAALAPVVLAPIFNDFTPLPEGETRSDMLELADAAGVKVGEVYSVDASRRTTAANAYVTGLGPTKRVVLFDTLLSRYSRDEVRVVVAHELAHVRYRDVLRGVAYAAIIAGPAALAVQRLSWALSGEQGTPGSVAPLALAAALVGGPTGMIGNRLSRALERRADHYSLELSKAPEAFVSFERRIAVQNVADLRPPATLTALLATHPPTAERIGAAVAWSRLHGDADASRNGAGRLGASAAGGVSLG